MKWFQKEQKLDHKTILLWIFALRSNSDITNMRAMRKQVQAGMFNEIITHLLPLASEEDGDAAYLLVHFFSGRVDRPTFAEMLEANPDVTRKARSVFSKAAALASPSEQFETTAVYNCCLEVANETIEKHYTEALVLANHGVKLWPGHGELWRERGVLKMISGDYQGALEDLRRAASLNPEMDWLAEPIAFAERKLAG